eukprot:scaffold36015_cov68-Phaeocystis_antarctica.AAC.4
MHRQRRWHSTLRHSGHKLSLGVSRFTLPSSTPVWSNVPPFGSARYRLFCVCSRASHRLWAARHFQPAPS